MKRVDGKVMAAKTIYWTGWARRVGESKWHVAVNVLVDDPRVGWCWLEQNWRPEDFDAHSVCMLRVGETPYKRRPPG